MRARHTRALEGAFLIRTAGGAGGCGARRCARAILMTLVIFAAVMDLRSNGVESKDSENSTEFPRALELQSVENGFQLGPRLFSGGSPQGEDGFRELARLGVTTVVSVDGASPRVEMARSFGLRYIHLPIGYDRIETDRQLQIVRAARQSEGAVFFHCHHGKHRGPAAAALAAMWRFDWDRQKALHWLEEAGTSPAYQGLIDSVGEFHRPSAEQLDSMPDQLPERAEVSELAARMVEGDQRWERLKLVRAAGNATPAEHPDLDPRRESLLLAEWFRELARQRADREPPEFLRLARQGEEAALELTDGFERLTPAGKPALEEAYRRLSQTCRACHEQFRN